MAVDIDQDKASRGQSISAWGFVLAMYLMRPSHMGEGYNLIGLLLLLGVSVFATFSNDWKPSTRTNIKPFMLLILWIFLYFHSILNGVDSDFPLFSAISAIIVFLSAVFLLGSKSVERRISRNFIYALAFFGFSSIVTAVLTPVFGTSKLFLFVLRNKSYATTGDILFPFTMAYDYKIYAWGLFPRMSLGWREAGIAQAIYAWALAIVLFAPKFKGRIFLIIVLSAAIVMTQSTLAYSNLMLVLIGWYLPRAKWTPFNIFVTLPITLVISGFLIYFSIFDENIGFASKEHGDSYLDRYYAVQAGIDLFKENPLGVGVYARSSDYNAGINLISSAGFIGIFGFILAVIAFLAPTYLSENRYYSAVCVLPIIVTALTSQPLLDSFGIWLLIFIDPADVFGYDKVRKQVKLTGRALLQLNQSEYRSPRLAKIQDDKQRILNN